MPAETHSHGPTDLDPHAVAALVVDRLSELLGRDPDDVTVDERLREDLDADDLVILDLFDAIEDEIGERTVGLRLDDDDLGELVTVGDVIEYVTNLIERAQA